MHRTLLRSLAILSLALALSSQALIAAPDMAQTTRVRSTETRVDIDLKHLFQHWVHSSEEEQPGGTVQIYRPDDSMNFPPSRFRMAYKFSADGTCDYHVLSPDDAHRFSPCRWTISVSDKVILRISTNGGAISYGIAQLTAKILRLRPMEPLRNS